MGTSFLGMMEAEMPPGFRFHPRDEELINDYLAKKLSGDSISCPMLVDVDLNKVEPWDIPGEACVGGKEWYFYSLRDRKYATGQRTNRATLSGYWKATGKDRPVLDTRKRVGKLVGMRKTLVFYQGRAPKGKKTDWVMHEFRVEPFGNGSGGDDRHRHSSASTASKEDWVLCRVFYKSRGLSMKPNILTSTSGDAAASSMKNCYDDTGSSCLPPLMDSFINFEQPRLPPQGLYAEQVPCFSSLLSSSHPSFPLLHHRSTLESGMPIRQFVTFPDLNPFLGGFSGEKKPFSVLDHLGKMEEGGRRSEAAPPPPEGSSESFLTETGGQSRWT